jgi:hypothetical protein
MSSRRFLAVVGAVAPLPRIAFGAEFVNRCVDIAAVRAAITGYNGKLIELTPDQWQFLRGIYAMNLETPPGLPCDAEAVLAHVDGEPDCLVFFVDSDKACTPTHAPRGLLSLMDRFGAAGINHQGASVDYSSSNWAALARSRRPMRAGDKSAYLVGTGTVPPARSVPHPRGGWTASASRTSSRPSSPAAPHNRHAPR